MRARFLVAATLASTLVAMLATPAAAQYDSVRVDSVRPGPNERLTDLDPARPGVQFRWCIRYTPFGGSQPSGTTRVDSASIFVQAPPQSQVYARTVGTFPQVNQCGAATGGSSVLGDTATVPKGTLSASITALIQFARTPNPNNLPPIFAGVGSRFVDPVHFFPTPAVLTITGDSIRSTALGHAITVQHDMAEGQLLILRRLGKLRVGELLVPTGFVDTLRSTNATNAVTWNIAPLNFGALFRYDVTSDTVPGLARGRDRALVRAGTVAATTVLQQPVGAPNQPYAPRFDVFGRALPGMVVRIAQCSACDRLNDSVTVAADSSWRFVGVGWPTGGQNTLVVVGRDIDGFADTTGAAFPVTQNVGPAVRVTSPVVAPSGPGRDSIVVAVGQSLNFAATGTDDGSIASWFWDFGNQTSANVQNPGVRSYPIAGRFNVTLRATDDLGAFSNTDTLIVKVRVRPVVRIIEPAEASTQPQRFDIAGRATPGATVTLTACASCGAQGTTRIAAGDSSWRYTNVLFAPAPQGVSLIVTVSDTTTLTSADTGSVFVLANQPPTVTRLSPAADSVLIAQGDSVFFAVQSSDPDGTIASRQWRRGVIALGAADTLGWRVQPDTGNFAYGFRAVDNIGDSTVTRYVVRVVANAPPVAAIVAPSADTTVAIGAPITFVGTASDPDGPAPTVLWQFGDGRTASVLAPAALSYPTAGTYTVTLRATDAFGRFAVDTVRVTVRARPAVRLIAPAAAASLPPRFDVTGRATPGATVRIIQCTGCSKLDSTRVAAGDSSFTFAAVDWSLAGPNNSITVRATDGFGLTQDASVGFTVVANRAPVAAITAPAADTVVLVGSSITFTGTASDPDGPAPTVLWNFGDGRTASVLTPPALSYPTAGTYTVTLRATDAFGLFAVDTVVVQVRTRPTVRLTAPTDGSTRPSTFDVTGRASPGATVRVSQCTGCSKLDSTRVAAGDSSFTFAAVAWSILGPNNRITVRVSDAFGFTDSTTVTFTVQQNRAPTVTITQPAADRAIAVGDSVAFAATASDPDGDLLRVRWTFAPGDTVIGASVAPRRFPVGGTFPVIVRATDPAGAFAEDTVTITVGGRGPNVDVTSPGSATRVDGHDVVFVMRAMATQDLRGDVNGDGVVDRADLALVRAAFGTTIPVASRDRP